MPWGRQRLYLPSATTGSMVLSVCLGLLGDSHAAEDAFQATFLVFVRRMNSIRSKESVGSWLHCVAQRIALRTRSQAAKRRSLERKATIMHGKHPIDEVSCQELRTALDEEIGSLPEKCRAPLFFCYLEGKSYDRAAQELGCTKISLSRRLARARELLQRRLTRREQNARGRGRRPQFETSPWDVTVEIECSFLT